MTRLKTVKKKKEYSSVDEYIHAFPEPIQKKLQEIRNTIKKLVPEAEEKISYQMPTFYLNGNLVWFAGHVRHIGFYPKTSGIEAFKTELTKYKHAKGTIQFPLNEPLPIDLIKKIVAFRVEENTNKK